MIFYLFSSYRAGYSLTEGTLDGNKFDFLSPERRGKYK